MDGAHAAHNHTAHDMALECDGSHPQRRWGTWQGHVYPGAVFIVWGAWWALAGLTAHLWRSPRRPYRGRAWWPFPLRPLRLMEPVLKIVVPAVAVSMELWLDHDFQYRYLFCPPGTKYEGRFALSHLNNWQHTLSYPGFVLSGLVDLLALWVPLPPGTSQGVLSSAFATSAFIMFTHEKHEPQDKMVHWLLAVAMLLSTLAVAGEMLPAARRSALAGAAKAAALILQGAWLVQIAAVEFKGKPQWSTDYEGGAMLLPAIFCTIATGVLACMVALYVALAALQQRGWLPQPALLAAAPLEDEATGLPLHSHGLNQPHHHKPLPTYDSANQSDDNDALDDSQLLLRGGAAGKERVAPFHISHARADTAGDAYV